MARFDRKVCIVAGGARGIGAATAALFVKEGGKVVIADLNRDLGEELVVQLGKDRAVFHDLDVRSPESCRACVQRAVDAFGGADYLVNCAIKMAPGHLKNLTLDDWKFVIDIGLTGTFLICQGFGSWAIDQGRRAAIVNLSSTAGIQPYTLSGAYSTVKAGIIMLSDHLAIEWARKGIRVNVVSPGQIETPLTAYLKDPEIKKARSEITPLGRIGQPEDVAAGILFLLSDEAAYITASRLDIDGGLGKSVFNHIPGRTWN